MQLDRVVFLLVEDFCPAIDAAVVLLHLEACVKLGELVHNLRAVHDEGGQHLVGDLQLSYRAFDAGWLRHMDQPIVFDSIGP